MKDLKVHSILFYFLLLQVTVAAQQPFSRKVDIEEENLTIKANVILKDRDGFLWAGTSEGIFKYNAAVPEKIPVPGADKVYITALFQDRSGIIWGGCKDGRIVLIKHNGTNFFNPKEGLPGVSITAIYEDAGNRLWLLQQVKVFIATATVNFLVLLPKTG
jgi:ligand-binding sensor domain-containing protein